MYGRVRSLFDAEEAEGESEDALDVGIVVGGVEVGLGHVGADKRTSGGYEGI